MIDSLSARDAAARLRQRATHLVAATAIGAAIATLAVTLIAESSAGNVLVVAVIGLVVVLALALAAVRQQHRSTHAALEVEAENASLLVAQEEIATAGLARARFIADVSHDLRQPLHALGLFLDALEHRVTPGEGEKILARTREASGVLNRAFDALIDLTRVEADTLIPEVELFAIDDVLARLAEESSVVSIEAGIDLLVVHSSAQVVTDERLIGHMLRTLLANAFDCGPGRLLLGARHRGGHVWIELHCSNPGSPVGKWDVLNTAEPTRPSGGSAQDLDLLVVRRLADLMGLSLRVAGKPGRGIVIAIGMPKPNAMVQATLRNRAVLLVADDPARRLASASALACAGAVVHVAGNLRQADHAARSNRFDLLVTDLAAGDVATREARMRLAASITSLPDQTSPDSLVAAADAVLAS
jgi:K+-sensing histidine kinase KdpD